MKVADDGLRNVECVRGWDRAGAVAPVCWKGFTDVYWGRKYRHFNHFCSRLAGLTRWRPSHWFPSLEQYVKQAVKVYLQDDTCLWMCYFLIERKADMDTGLLCLHLHVSDRLWYTSICHCLCFLFSCLPVVWPSLEPPSLLSGHPSILSKLTYIVIVEKFSLFWHPLLCSRELEEIPKESRGWCICMLIFQLQCHKHILWEPGHALENGLSDVDITKGGQKSSSSSRASDSSEGRGARAKVGAIRTGVSSSGEDESGHCSCEQLMQKPPQLLSALSAAAIKLLKHLMLLKIHQICQGYVHSNHTCLWIFPQVNSIGRAISCVLNLHCK